MPAELNFPLRKYISVKLANLKHGGAYTLNETLIY